MVEGLDEERIEVLRRWGEGLVGDARQELRAAGRAIVLLIEEIDRLRGELGNERSLPKAVAPLEAEARVIHGDVQSTLRARLAQLGRRRKAEDAGPKPADVAPPGSASS